MTGGDGGAAAAWRRWLPGPLGRRPLLALLLLAAALLLWHLGAYGLWESTEARYAEIAARMVRSGDWTTPRLNYIAHYDKPPLAYWLTGLGMLAVGVTELGARLPLVAAALAALALVHRRAAEVGGDRAAAYALLCLLSAPLFFALARSVSTDLYLTLWVLVAAEAGRRGSRVEAARGWRLLAWAAIGAGFLTKGPVVLLWTALPALAWAAAGAGRWRRLARLADPLGVLFCLAVSLPWFLAAVARHPDLVDFWLGRQTVGRVVAPYDGERDPWWTYLVVLGWASGPWLLPALLELARSARLRRRASYLLFWTAVPLVAFSLFPTKRANYLLPALPPIAMAAGAWWAAAGRRPAAAKVSRALGAVMAAVGGGLLAVGFVAELPTPLPALGPTLGPAFVLGGVAAWVATGRRRFDLVFAGCLIPILGVYLAGYAALARPAVEAWFKISRPLAVAAAEHLEDGEPIVAYRTWPRALPFYLDRRLVTVSDEGRVTEFEEDERWREFVFTEDSVFTRLARGPRALFVLPRGELGEIEERLGSRLTPLAATRRQVLATNRPTPEEEAADAARARPIRDL